MAPIVLVLLSGSGGALVGGFFGWLLGKSQANEEIKTLQKLIQALVEVNREREVEIQTLRQQVQALQSELTLIKASRGAIQRFMRWLVGEHPEVIALYQKITEGEERITTLETEMATDAEELDGVIGQLRKEYPDEMAKWESRLAS